MSLLTEFQSHFGDTQRTRQKGKASHKMEKKWTKWERERTHPQIKEK